MPDSEEKKARDSRTISIEIPAGGFEGMFRMMAGRGGIEKAGPGCCESSRDKCCAPTGENDDREFKIAIKRKER
jgi:hypothetical protein